MRHKQGVQAKLLHQNKKALCVHAAVTLLRSFTHWDQIRFRIAFSKPLKPMAPYTLTANVRGATK